MKYQYEELKERAMRFDATQQDRLNLLKWFEQYGSCYWNGEEYALENGYGLKPIYKGIGEADEDGDYEEYEVVDAIIR